MRFERVIAVFGALMCLGWTAATDARGTQLTWPEAAWPLPLAESDYAWTRAAAYWTEVSDVGFRPVAGQGPAPDGIVALRWVHTGDEWARIVGDDGAVGFTVYTSRADGTLEDADVYLNAARFRFSDSAERGAYATEGVLRHELGHVLGLGHTCGARLPCGGLDEDDSRLSAIMFPRVGPGEVRAASADDVAGLGSISGFPLSSRRPTLTGVISEDPHTWVVEFADFLPEDIVEVWTQTRVPATMEPSERGVRIQAEATPPLDLVVWSTSGQGVRSSAALALSPVPDAGSFDGGTDALDDGRMVDIGVEPPSATDGGCNAVAAPVWIMFVIARRRRRREDE